MEMDGMDEMEEGAPAEEDAEAASALTDVPDEDLIAEMKARGLLDEGEDDMGSDMGSDMGEDELDMG